MKAQDTPAMKSRCLKHSGNSAKVRTLHSRPLAKLATRLRSGAYLGLRLVCRRESNSILAEVTLEWARRAWH